MSDNKHPLTNKEAKWRPLWIVTFVLSFLAISPVSSFAQSTSVSSDAIGYYRLTINPGFQTVSVSLTNEAVFTSNIASSTTNTITSSYGAAQLGTILDTVYNVSDPNDYEKHYYVEITNGPTGVDDEFVGHRFEVDEATTNTANSSVITIDQTSITGTPFNTLATVPNLAGYQMELREHVRIRQIFDSSDFDGSTSVGNADQLLIFNGVSYETYFVFQSGSIKFWTRIGAGLASFDDRPLYPSQGIFFRRKTGFSEVDLIIKGKVRANPFVQPLIEGFNLVAEGYPISISPTDRNASPGTFTGAASVGDADQISVFNGSGYDTYYLFSFSTFQFWRKLNGGFTDYSLDDEVFKYNNAVFLRRQSADPTYRVSVPWQP